VVRVDRNPRGKVHVLEPELLDHLLGVIRSASVVGAIVWSTTVTSSSVRVSRSVCWRRRVLNRSMVWAPAVEAAVDPVLDATPGRAPDAKLGRWPAHPRHGGAVRPGPARNAAALSRRG
jgi:hypothetical protein